MLLAKRDSMDAGALAARAADASHTPGSSRESNVRSSIECSCRVWCLSNSLALLPSSSRADAGALAGAGAASVFTCSAVTRMPEMLRRRWRSSASSSELSSLLEAGMGTAAEWPRGQPRSVANQGRQPRAAGKNTPT